MNKIWHFREFKSLSEASVFANDRGLTPGEIIIGPVNTYGFIEAMYFAEQP